MLLIQRLEPVYSTFISLAIARGNATVTLSGPFKAVLGAIIRQIVCHKQFTSVKHQPKAQSHITGQRISRFAKYAL